MLVARSDRRRPRPTDPDVAAALAAVSPDRLRGLVDALSFPRHYIAERRANVRARDFLVSYLRDLGYTPTLQGSYDNVVATTGDAAAGGALLLGAHYDSVPGTPGADDNASAVAACLECARLLAGRDVGLVAVVLFNREEDGLLGSTEFVADLPPGVVAEAHVFEMIGYCTTAPGSQRMPPGLPANLAPDVGNFLALLANHKSNAAAEELVRLAAGYVPGFPVLALKMYLGVEKLFGHLHRSDHAPFWKAGIPAVMWTDTAEFRNPHYHQQTDTPDTLDFDFLARVTRLALARTLTRAG
jgi:Zn-dependent M28 family amino/carboxypeptidase